MTQGMDKLTAEEQSVLVDIVEEKLIEVGEWAKWLSKDEHARVVNSVENLLFKLKLNFKNNKEGEVC